MGGSTARRAEKPCPSCQSVLTEILWRDNYSDWEVLETHCRQCGYCETPEGEVLNPGRLKGLPEFTHPKGPENFA